MSLTLTKENGSGLADANSYASVADGDSFHDGHLYASAWTGATADQKSAALVMASRLIDAEYQFSGVRTTDAQALAWPRYRCPDPDRDSRLLLDGNWLPENQVPKNVIAAACELARELLIADRTASPAGEGLKYHNESGSQTGYDKADRRPIISPVAQAMLGKYGSLVKSKSGAVRLVRA